MARRAGRGVGDSPRAATTPVTEVWHDRPEALQKLHDPTRHVKEPLRATLINNTLGAMNHPTPEVGMGATILMWSDRHGASMTLDSLRIARFAAPETYLIERENS